MQIRSVRVILRAGPGSAWGVKVEQVDLDDRGRGIAGLRLYMRGYGS
ncbi:hypothetical protein I552_3622 [Mycobacterium xenopi 3993]|nr:hypothetical protein I552_3622 [Mycobacterium xenopi 3993]